MPRAIGCPEPGWLRAQPAFVRIHQDFMRTVLRGGKPQIVKDVRAHLGRDVGLEEFKYWTALVGSAFLYQ